MPDSTDHSAYRQQARQLRARLRNNPAALYRALSDLNGANVTLIADRAVASHRPGRKADPEAVGGKNVGERLLAGGAATGRATPIGESPLAPPARRRNNSITERIIWALSPQQRRWQPAQTCERPAPRPAPEPAAPRAKPAVPTPVRVSRADATAIAPAPPRLGLAPDSPAQNAVERAFTFTVRQHLHGAILSYSNRQSLLRAADRLRLDRFRANLLIASAQRRAANELGVRRPLSAAEVGEAPTTPAKSDAGPGWPVWTWAMLTVAAELAITAAALHVWR